MPKYKANVPMLISHESRIVQAGEVFETVFPKVKLADGTEADMKLGDNLSLAGDTVAEDKGKAKKAKAE